MAARFITRPLSGGVGGGQSFLAAALVADVIRNGTKTETDRAHVEVEMEMMGKKLWYLV